jgi:hypothetical protein
VQNVASAIAHNPVVNVRDARGDRNKINNYFDVSVIWKLVLVPINHLRICVRANALRKWKWCRDRVEINRHITGNPRRKPRARASEAREGCSAGNAHLSSNGEPGLFILVFLQSYSSVGTSFYQIQICRFWVRG